jgi:hypothetical protein
MFFPRDKASGMPLRVVNGVNFQQLVLAAILAAPHDFLRKRLLFPPKHERDDPPI